MEDFRFRRYAKTMLPNALSNENVFGSYKSVRKQSNDHVYIYIIGHVARAIYCAPIVTINLSQTRSQFLN